MVISRVARLPYIGEPHEKPLKSYEVKIAAVPIPEPKPDIVPLWIIILSACIGVIILLLLIYLLYKVNESNLNLKILSKPIDISNNLFNYFIYLFFFLQIVWILQA